MRIGEAYKFCPRCGSKYAAKSDGQKLHCDNCGLDNYLNPKPVESAILFNGLGKLLFVVRAFEPRKGFLDFPGGFVDPNEDFEQSVRREVKEELGIEVGRLDYHSTHTDRYSFQGINYQVVGVAYVGKLPPGAKLMPADDVASVEFYKLDEVPVEQIAWPSMHEMLAILRQQQA